MADGKSPLTRSRIWSMTKVAIENELRERHISFPPESTREQLRKLLRNVFEQSSEDTGNTNSLTNGPPENQDPPENLLKIADLPKI